MRLQTPLDSYVYCIAMYMELLVICMLLMLAVTKAVVGVLCPQHQPLSYHK